MSENTDAPRGGTKRAEITIDGKTYTVDFSLRAIRRIERAWGKPVAQLNPDVAQWSTDVLCCLLYGGLESARTLGLPQPEGRHTSIAYTVDEAADLIDAAGGMSNVIIQMGGAFLGSRADPETSETARAGKDGPSGPDAPQPPLDTD